MTKDNTGTISSCKLHEPSIVISLSEPMVPLSELMELINNRIKECRENNTDTSELLFIRAMIRQKCKLNDNTKTLDDLSTDYFNLIQDCAMSITKNTGIISRYLKTLPQEVFDLVFEEKIEVYVIDDEVELCVNCNDLFFWGCAEDETITLEDIPAFIKALEDTPKWGTDLWVARKRGMRPQKPIYKNMTKQEKALFDACGPKREF